MPLKFLVGTLRVSVDALKISLDNLSRHFRVFEDAICIKGSQCEAEPYNISAYALDTPSRRFIVLKDALESRHLS